MCEPPSIDNPRPFLYGPSLRPILYFPYAPSFIFSERPTFDNIFWQYRPNHKQGKHKN